MADESPDESAVLAFAPGLRPVGKEQLGTVERVHQDGHLRLDQRLQVVLQNGHDVVQTLDDGAVNPVRR